MILAWDDINKSARYSTENHCWLYKPYNLRHLGGEKNRLNIEKKLKNDQNDPNLRDINPKNNPNISQTEITPQSTHLIPSSLCYDHIPSRLDNPTHQDSDNNTSPHHYPSTSPTHPFPPKPQIPLSQNAIHHQKYISSTHRTTIFRFPSSNAKDLTFLTRLYSLLQLILIHLQTGSYISLRDIYYSHPNLFISQEISNGILLTAQSILRCTRDDFNIIMADRGLCLGPFFIRIKTIRHKKTCPFGQVGSFGDNNSFLTSRSQVAASEMDDLMDEGDNISPQNRRNSIGFHHSKNDTSRVNRKRYNQGECFCNFLEYGCLDFSTQPQSLYSFSKSALLHCEQASMGSMGGVGIGNRSDELGDGVIGEMGENNYPNFDSGQNSKSLSNNYGSNNRAKIDRNFEVRYTISFILNHHQDETRNYNNFEKTVPKILIVEKEAIFSRLIQHQYNNTSTKYHSKNLSDYYEDISTSNTIFITSKGYPTITARKFISNITNPAYYDTSVGELDWDSGDKYREDERFPDFSPNSRLLNKKNDKNSSLEEKTPEQFILVDGDPYGIDICLKYITGSPNQCLDCPFSLRFVRYIGIRPSIIYKLLQLQAFHQHIFLQVPQYQKNNNQYDNALQDRDSNDGGMKLLISKYLNKLLLDEDSIQENGKIANIKNDSLQSFNLEGLHSDDLNQFQFFDYNLILFLYFEYCLKNSTFAPGLNNTHHGIDRFSQEIGSDSTMNHNFHPHRNNFHSNPPSSLSSAFPPPLTSSSSLIPNPLSRVYKTYPTNSHLEAMLFQPVTTNDTTLLTTMLSQPFFATNRSNHSNVKDSKPTREERLQAKEGKAGKVEKVENLENLEQFQNNSGKNDNKFDIIEQNRRILQLELEFMLKFRLKCEIEVLLTIHLDCLMGYCNYMCKNLPK